MGCSVGRVALRLSRSLTPFLRWSNRCSIDLTGPWNSLGEWADLLLPSFSTRSLTWPCSSFLKPEGEIDSIAWVQRHSYSISFWGWIVWPSVLRRYRSTRWRLDKAIIETGIALWSIEGVLTDATHVATGSMIITEWKQKRKNKTWC